jgi:hypothetical protein
MGRCPLSAAATSKSYNSAGIRKYSVAPFRSFFMRGNINGLYQNVKHQITFLIILLDRHYGGVTIPAIGVNLLMTRDEAEAKYGKIVVSCQCPPIPTRNLDFVAYYDNFLDYDMPNWMQSFGSTEEEALTELLAKTEEHGCVGSRMSEYGADKGCPRR